MIINANSLKILDFHGTTMLFVLQYQLEFIL